MRNKFINLVFTFILITSIIGCGSTEEDIPETISEAAQPEADSFLLISSDTISTDLAADYDILLVDDFDASSTGFIAILDGSDATVTLISPEGTITSAGGKGNAPGEFLWPVAVSVSDEGIVAVSDFMLGSVRIYEPGLEYFSELGGFMMANPGVIFTTGLETFIGMRIYYKADGDETLVGHQTARWTVLDSEPDYIYTETMKPFSINDFGASIVSPYPMACNSNGEVFVADVSRENYILTKYREDGEILWTQELPFEQIEKTEEEIDIEEAMVQRRMEQSTHQMNFIADPYHFAVLSLATGPTGKLWAEIPGHDNTFFEVFDQTSGEYLFSVESNEQYERLEVTPGGIFAITEGDAQALIQLELAELE